MQYLDSHVGLLRKNLILLDMNGLRFILLETILLNNGSIDGNVGFEEDTNDTVQIIIIQHKQIITTTHNQSLYIYTCLFSRS